MSNLSQFFSGGARVWVSGTTYSIGNVVLSPADNYQEYVRITNGAGATDPLSDTTNYRPYGGRDIKSIQRGVISITGSGIVSATATISSVNTAKTRVRLLGFSAANSAGAFTDSRDVYPRLQLTSSTQLTATKATQSNANINITLSYEVEESY